jgi:hypothetical protein
MERKLTQQSYYKNEKSCDVAASVQTALVCPYRPLIYNSIRAKRVCVLLSSLI